MAELIWRRSRRCDTNSCVEVATGADRVHVRDSKLPPTAPTLSFTSTAWAGFVAGIRAGGFA